MNLYFFGRAVSYPVARLAFKVRYEGLEHIPQGGGYILACNHRSNFDPILISHKVTEPISYLAKYELVQNPFIGFIFRSLGIIPIQRGKGDTGAIDRAGEVIHSGGVLGMFPEGHRSKDGKPLRPRSGVALIAGQTQADILPVAVSYVGGVRFRSPVTVRYGPLIPNAELGIDTNSPSAIRTASRLIMDEIIALMEPLPQLALAPGEEE